MWVLFYFMNTDKTAYQRKLAHPEWQRKRLEVMERDNFTCQFCFSTDEELHVHHIYYLSNHQPWEYPLDAYKTFCHQCHQEEEEYLKEKRFTVFDDLRRLGLDSGGMNMVLSHLGIVKENGFDVEKSVFFLSWYTETTQEERDSIEVIMAKVRERWHKNREMQNGTTTEK